MKKVYLLFFAVLGMISSTNAQTLADIETILGGPLGTVDNPFDLPCNDSFDYDIVLINKGPGTIGATDTVQFYSPWVPDGYINTESHDGVAVPANDTIAHYSGKIHRNEIERLFDPSSGEPVFKPFDDGQYLFAILARGFRNVDTNVLKDPNSDNNDDAALVNISCATGISFKGQGKQSLQIFPNPAAAEVRFVSNMTANNATVRVTDIAGRTVLVKDFGKQRSGNVELKLDISALNDGLYYVELLNGEKRSVSKLSVQQK